MSDSKRNNWLHEQFSMILSAAMDGEDESAADHLVAVGTKYGHSGVYGICCALAEAVRVLGFPGVQQGDGSLTGDIMIVEKLPGSDGDPATLWACRFVVAYINGDRDTCTSLFFGSFGHPRAERALVSGVTELIIMAADIARAKEAESS